MKLIGTPIGTGPTSVAPLTRLTQLRNLFLGPRPKSLKNLTDIYRLGEITTLEMLQLDRIPDLPSIAWVRPLKRLRHLAIGGTSILDRDLSPLLELPALTFVGLDIPGFKPGGTRYAPSYESILDPIRARRLAAEELARKNTSEMR